MKILFQGDSITDAGRNREDVHHLGYGYPKYAAEFIKAAHPETEFEFIDLGISGNQTKDLVARLDADFIEIQPDIVSIMIGINDVWHNAEKKTWLANEVFEARYRTVLTAIKEKTNAKIMIIEPFLLPTSDKDYFREDLDPKIQVVRKLAREFADVYMPTDGLLASALIGRQSSDFSADGVHPNAFGSETIGRWYAEYVERLI